MPAHIKRYKQWALAKNILNKFSFGLSQDLNIILGRA